MPSPFKELGSTGLQQWGGVIMVEPDVTLRGQLGYRVFDEIRTQDPTGIAMYLVLTLPIRRVQWSCLPGGASARDEEAATFAWSAFSDTSHSFNDLIADACLMFVYGWTYFHMVMKRRRGDKGKSKSQFNDGLVGFRKIAFRSPLTLDHWEFDEESGDILGLWQYQIKTGNVIFIPLNESLLFRTSREGDNPEGLSIFRPAVRSYKYKRRLEQIEGIGLYRRWAGFPLLKLPDGATARAEVAEGEVSDEQRAEELVQAIYEDRMMGSYIPKSWDLELGGPEGTIDRTMSDTIVRKDSEMARAILAQWLLLGLREVGTRSLAQTLQESFALAVEAYLQIITDELNRYAIPYLFSFNPWPGLTGYPTLTHTSPRALDLQKLGQYVTALSGAGAFSMDMPTENFLRAQVPGMPEAPEEEEEPVGDEGDGEGRRAGGAEEEQPKPESGEGEPGTEGEGYSRIRVPARRREQFLARGAEHFGPAAPEDRPARYVAFVDANAEAQRQNLTTWADQLSTEVAGLGTGVDEVTLRSKLDDLLLVGLLLFREKSALDLAAAFWLGFGPPTGDARIQQALRSEISRADAWIGYGGDGRLAATNPAGKSSLFGDIRGELEGQIAAILLLLKAGREDDAWILVHQAVEAATQGFARAELYAGEVWHSIWSGALERGRLEDLEQGYPSPMRWVLDVIAKHCRMCPIFGANPPGREYPSIDALIAFTGGILPGQGTECNGRCRCHLERLTGGIWVWL